MPNHSAKVDYRRAAKPRKNTVVRRQVISVLARMRAVPQARFADSHGNWEF
jgi:hypothetical protein